MTIESSLHISEGLSPEIRKEVEHTEFEAKSPAETSPFCNKEVTYSWDVDTDQISWEGDASEVFQTKDRSIISNGASFESLLDQISTSSRYSEIFDSKGKDCGTGVPFSVRYLINPSSGVRFWVEDSGRWFANNDGRPWLVHGVCRKILAPTPDELALVSKQHFDHTTGALIYEDLINALTYAIEKNKKDTSNLILMLITIKDFDEINKVSNSYIGDEILASLVLRIRVSIRRKDIIGRYSADKIAIIFNPSMSQHLEFIVKRLIKAVQLSPINTSTGLFPCNILAGCVAIPDEADTTETAIKAVEEALSNAIKNPERYHMYRKKGDENSFNSQNREASDAVLSALNEHRIHVFYQPIISTITGKINKYEALVRMITPQGNWVGADNIVPIAEQSGFLHLVDHRVMQIVIDKLRERHDITLSLNVGADTALNSDWKEALKAYIATDISLASRLIVEITETSIIEDIQKMRAMIEEIKELGIKVAIDDFGSGYTSFRNIRLLPIDILKIDGIFIKNLSSSPDDRFFVQTLLQLARHLKIDTVAEWVQDEETAKILTSWNVEYLQGDYIGKPSISLINENNDQYMRLQA